MKRNILYVIFTILNISNANCQIKFIEGNSPQKGDTVFLVVTNRNRDSVNNELGFGHLVDTEKECKIMLSWYRNNKWELQLLDSIQQGIELLGINENFLVHVHGDGQNFPTMLYRAAGIKTIYDVNLIIFDFPTRKPGCKRIKNFYNSRNNAKQSTKDFKWFMQEINNSFKNTDTKVSLHLHSLGNYLFKKYSDKEAVVLDSSLFDNVIIDAAAVKKANHRKWIEHMYFQKRIYITYNEGDRTLMGAGIITFATQLGKNTGTKRAKNAFYINLSNPAYGFHNYFLDPRLFKAKPDVKTLYRSLFYGQKIDLLSGNLN